MTTGPPISPPVMAAPSRRPGLTSAASAARLVGDPDLDADVICCHQLTPELALDVSRAERVVLVDARRGGTPGTVETGAVQPEGRPSAFSHGLAPPALVALASSLFGRCLPSPP